MLEAKVWELTNQLEAFKTEPTFPAEEIDLFPELDSLRLEDFGTQSRHENQSSIEDLWSSQEKLMFLFNQTTVNTDKDLFKYLGKMSMCMKTEILKSDELNHLERFMLESSMSPDEVRQAFHSDALDKLNHAMRR